MDGLYWTERNNRFLDSNFRSIRADNIGNGRNPLLKMLVKIIGKFSLLLRKKSIILYILRDMS